MLAIRRVLLDVSYTHSAFVYFFPAFVLSTSRAEMKDDAQTLACKLEHWLHGKCRIKCCRWFDAGKQLIPQYLRQPLRKDTLRNSTGPFKIHITCANWSHQKTGVKRKHCSLTSVLPFWISKVPSSRGRSWNCSSEDYGKPWHILNGTKNNVSFKLIVKSWYLFVCNTVHISYIFGNTSQV